MRPRLNDSDRLGNICYALSLLIREKQESDMLYTILAIIVVTLLASVYNPPEDPLQ